MFATFLNALLAALAAWARHWPWLASRLNAFAINRAVNACRHRPHPWSTVHDYVSWPSLTDLTFSARHLPAVDITDLPAPERLIALFQRPTGSQRLCEKSTSLFPTFAQYLTDGFIRTRMPRGDETDDVRRRNTSNHQIDLCPLYGRLPAQTDCLRLRSPERGRRGRLKSVMREDGEYAPALCRDDGSVDPEFAALDEPLGLSGVTDPGQRASLFAMGGDRVNTSPQVAWMNTLFLREHNRMAGLIERAHSEWDDERVFQTARNTVIPVFIKIVVEEYINHIAPTPIRLMADPAVAWDAPWNKPNWITTEFSLLYRWHSLVPDVMTWGDTDYAVFETILDNRPLLKTGMARAFEDLGRQRASALGAFNTADALLDIEARSINQGRVCRLAPYSDYRHYMSLTRPRDFGDISSDPRVVDLLRGAYRRPEDVEFYIGLFAEDTVPNSPLPELILKMVAVDAFSQALTNPLLSRHVFKESTFSKPGWGAIHETGRLADVVARNTPGGGDFTAIGMTRAGWKRR